MYTRSHKKDSGSARKDIESATRDAKSWWRSLDASEREAGFATWKYQIPSILFIKIPLPFLGALDVIVISPGGVISRRVNPTEGQLKELRGIVGKPGKDGWSVSVTGEKVVINRNLNEGKVEGEITQWWGS